MEKLTKRDKRTNLEKEIDAVLVRMSSIDSDTKEYTAMAANLEMLYKAKANEKSRSISPDTIAVIVGNLLGIILIINYEQTGIITTKALGFVLRGRV